MSRSIVYVLALTMLAAAAFTPSPRLSPATGSQFSPAVAALSPTPAATPTDTPPTPDGSDWLTKGLDSGDPSQADHAVQEVVDWAREASGLRAELGPHADELFRLVEQAQAALLEQLLAQQPAGAKPKGMPAPLPPPRWAPPHMSAQTSLAQLSLLLVMAPLQLSASQTGDAGPQVKEFDEKLGDNATAHFKQQMQVSGSKLEMDMDMTMRAEKDGTVYEEKAKGKLNLNICPDDKGNVPLDLTLQSKGGSDDKGFEINLAMHAVGHVDDEGNLAGYDHDGETELILRTGRNWFGGVNTEQGQVHLGWSIGGMNTPGVKGVSFTPGQEGYSLSYIFAKPEVKERIRKLAVDLSMLEVALTFKSAELKWQDGFCVAINVAEGKSQSVPAGSETPFTAAVRHKFEGTDLAVPVIATLKSGAVSVTPSDAKVLAPGTFRYKAPDTSGQDATVELISRSRRGVGKLNVKFMTEQLYYRVDQVIADGRGSLTGDICALDRPFVLTIGGRNVGSGQYVGTFKFAPAGTGGGTWIHKATTTCLPQLGCGTVTASGTYQVDSTSSKPVIIMNETTQTSSIGGKGGTSIMPGWTFELEPETGTCSVE